MLAQSKDTDVKIEKILISMIRQESIAKRASRMCSLSQTTRQLSRRAIKRAHPTFNEQQLKQLFIKYIYDLEVSESFCHHFNNKPQQAMKKSDIIEAAHPIAFQRRKKDTLDAEDENALKFYLASSEDIILNKLDWFRIAGYISEQWRDIRGVLKIQQESLDRDYLFHWATELELTDLLEKACFEAGL